MESIHELIRKGDVEQVTNLIENDNSVIEALDDRGWHPLHVAAELGNITIARLLIDHGANVNTRTEEGLDSTALDMASGNGSAELIQFLLSVGARIDLRDDYEFTPIHTAAIFARPQAVETLIQYGANPNDRVNGWTPLTYAEAHLNDLDSRPRFSEHVPPASEDDYKAVVEILRKHDGVA